MNINLYLFIRFYSILKVWRLSSYRFQSGSLKVPGESYEKQNLKACCAYYV